MFLKLGVRTNIERDDEGHLAPWLPDVELREAQRGLEVEIDAVRLQRLGHLLLEFLRRTPGLHVSPGEDGTDAKAA